MLKFIQISEDEIINIESIEAMYRNYLDGTVIIGKSGKEYISNHSLERILKVLENLEEEK